MPMTYAQWERKYPGYVIIKLGGGYFYRKLSQFTAKDFANRRKTGLEKDFWKAVQAVGLDFRSQNRSESVGVVGERKMSHSLRPFLAPKKS